VRLRAMAVVVSLLLLAQPASVAATAYSAVTHKFLWTPAGYTLTNLCVQAGEVDVNRNYGQAQAWVFSGSTNCSGTTRTLPSGWLGVFVEGYRDGAYCGSSGWYYSSQATWAWQLWITLCSNPSGQQSFVSYASGAGYDGSTGYYRSSPVASPAQNY